MVIDLDYKDVSNVLASWESIRRLDNYQEKVGVLFFQKYFEMNEKAKQIFSFAKQDKLDDEFFKNPHLINHSKRHMKALDTALSFLGPDIELLSEVLEDLGKRHTSYGVRTSDFLPMGKALIIVMKELLGDKFTPEIEQSWFLVYKSLAQEMMKSMRKHSSESTKKSSRRNS